MINIKEVFKEIFEKDIPSLPDKVLYPKRYGRSLVLLITDLFNENDKLAFYKVKETKEYNIWLLIQEKEKL